MKLNPKLEEELTNLHRKMVANNEVPSKTHLQHYYDTFLDRFGIERLQNLDGEALLTTMHAHGNRDSLVYWLEFKNDEEFPSRIFGSISGGSALKFGLYQRREDGSWMTGSPQNQVELTLDETITQAHKHREQLLRGVALLQQLPTDADDAAYSTLQEELNLASSGKRVGTAEDGELSGGNHADFAYVFVGWVKFHHTGGEFAHFFAFAVVG